MATFDNSTVGVDVSPSYAPQLDINNNVINVQLGDGYQQRLQKGINATRRTFTLPFNNRTDADVNAILNFLASSTGGNNGVKSFNWTPPFGATGKWICQDPQVTVNSFNLNDLQLTFKEVFEV